MNSSIETFYNNKDKDINYVQNYNIEHGPRLDAIIKTFNLKELKNQKIIDVGGGCGFLGQRLDSSNEYIVFDGSNISENDKQCKMYLIKYDLDYEHFGTESNIKNVDIGFCLEVLEHLSNPYHCLVEMKKMVKPNGDIYLSIPDVSVTHNTLYPGLIYPVQNFAQFLEQMALPIQDYFLFDKGWKTHIFKCKNASWENSKMLFPKQESKFFGKTPLEYTNL